MDVPAQPTKQATMQALRIINRFGGLAKAARAWDKAKSTLQRWKVAGFIHPDYYPTILDAAVSEGISLDPADFVLVDLKHPAFNAPRNPSPDSTAARSDRSGPRPKLDTEQLLEPGAAAAKAAPVRDGLDAELSSKHPLHPAPVCAEQSFSDVAKVSKAAATAD